MSERKLEIYDTTLRDGAQGEGISFSVNDKLKIVKLLDSLGIDYIEGGWPGANPKDIEFFNEAKNLKLTKSKLVAFGSTRKANVKASQDVVLNNLIEAGTDIVTIFGKSWDYHVEHALCTTNKENLNMIMDSITYLLSKNKRVFYDAEHFFDGYKANPDYALQTIEVAIKAGAERIILCETNGGALPCEVADIVKIVLKKFPKAMFGIHCHNDGEVAVANSLAGINAGIMQVQGTINGYGERCGNANLCSVIPNLELKMGFTILGEEGLAKLTFLANQVSEIANLKRNRYAPYVGVNAFTHKGGVHASGVRKSAKTYEHIDPTLVGNVRKIVVSDQSGIASIKDKLEQINFPFQLNDDQLKQVLDHIKKLEWQGYQFEDADASFDLMVRHVLGIRAKMFELQGFRVFSNSVDANGKMTTEASVKVIIEGEEIHRVAEGYGPGHAIDCALRRALSPYYPQIKKFHLIDFKVRILDGKDGTSAKTVLHVTTSNGETSWDTVGVSRNIIESTYLAIVDSLEYGILLHNRMLDGADRFALKA